MFSTPIDRDFQQCSLFYQSITNMKLKEKENLSCIGKKEKAMYSEPIEPRPKGNKTCKD
jgi:hypothetical protein